MKERSAQHIQNFVTRRRGDLSSAPRASWSWTALTRWATEWSLAAPSWPRRAGHPSLSRRSSSGHCTGPPRTCLVFRHQTLNNINTQNAIYCSEVGIFEGHSETSCIFRESLFHWWVKVEGLTYTELRLLSERLGEQAERQGDAMAEFSVPTWSLLNSLEGLGYRVMSTWNTRHKASLAETVTGCDQWSVCLGNWDFRH